MEPSLRVVHVHKDIYPPVKAGIERHIDALRRSMPTVESNVLVAARRRRTSVRVVHSGLEVRAAELCRVLSTPLAPSMPAWIRRMDSDLVHVHMPYPPGEASAVLAAGDRPIIVSYHADVVRQAWLAPLYGPIAKTLLRRAAAVVVGSDGMLERSPLLEDFRGKGRVVPYGIDTSRFDPERVSDDAVRAVRERFGGPLVVAVGRLVYYKGLDLLIDAVARMPLSLVIVGSGPMAGTLAARARDNPRVHFTGEIPDDELVELLAAADCYVLASTSRAESFGLATVEAQAMETPAVVTDLGTGTTDAIADRETGIAVAAGQARALEEGLRWIFADEDRRAAMARAARHRAVEQHSEDVQAKRMLAVYEDVLGHQHRAA